jgi:hypothetical protein
MTKNERLFGLTKVGIVTLFALSFMSILIGSWKNVVVILTGSTASDVLDRSIEETLLQLIGTINDYRFTSLIAIGLFWALVGIIVYLVLWAIGNLAIVVYNSWLINTKFINRNQNKLDQFTGKILRLLLIVGLPLMTILSFWIYYPWAVYRLNSLLNDFIVVELAWFIGDVFVVGAMGYIWIVWLRILLGKPYVI